jgi:outer membrane protein TolC
MQKTDQIWIHRWRFLHWRACLHRRFGRQGFVMHAFLTTILLLLLFSTTLHAQSRSLQDYLQAGKQNSPLLQDYENASSIAHLENQKVKANYKYPAIQASANIMEAPVINGVGYDEAITNGSWYAAQAGVSIPLFSKPFETAELNKNSLDAEKAVWQGKMSWNEVKRQIADGYAQCYADQRMLENARDLLEIITAQHHLSRELAQKGIMKGSDVLLIELEVSNQKIKVKDQLAGLQHDLHMLNALCGISDTSLVQLEKPYFLLSAEKADSSRFLQQFLFDSLMALNQQEQFNLKYKPKISAYADAGLNAVYLSSPQDNLGFSVGLSMNFTLFDHGQRKITEQQTEIRLNTANRYKQYFLTKRDQQLHSFLVQIELANQKINELDTQIGQYKRLMHIYKSELASGDLSVNDYLVFFRNYLQAEQEYINQHQNKNILINAYNYWNW